MAEEVAEQHEEIVFGAGVECPGKEIRLGEVVQPELAGKEGTVEQAAHIALLRHAASEGEGDDDAGDQREVSVVDKERGFAKRRAIDFCEQGIPFAELYGNAGFLFDAFVEGEQGIGGFGEGRCLDAEAGDKLVAGGDTADASRKELIEPTPGGKWIVGAEFGFADGEKFSLEIEMPRLETASVCDKADVLAGAGTGGKVFSEFALGIVALIVEVGFDLNDDVAIEGVDAAAEVADL